MNEFKKLGICEDILKSINEQWFKTPTEIQIKSIPLIIKGQDVLANSATGSGKTLAFASGLIQNSEKEKGIQALVLTPTRELAKQVTEHLNMFSKYKKLKIISIYGGVSINPQIDELKTADIVVGTPGRLLDHIQRNSINLSKVKTLVLDEADIMLDMGFIEDVEKIIKKCPEKRQTLLFSATFSNEIMKLSKRYMNNTTKISAKSYVDTKKLSQVFYDVEDALKFSLLVHFLKKDDNWLVMVFCNTQRSTDFIANNLKSCNINALPIHGGLSQNKRNQILKLFHEQKINVLVCTDVAARGLDIKNVSHVYNYDIPRNSKDYIHRIGRTARAGKDGKAVNILSKRDHDNFRRILTDKSLDIKKEKTPFIEKISINLFKPKTKKSHFRKTSNRNYR